MKVLMCLLIVLLIPVVWFCTTTAEQTHNRAGMALVNTSLDSRAQVATANNNFISIQGRGVILDLPAVSSSWSGLRLLQPSMTICDQQVIPDSPSVLPSGPEIIWGQINDQISVEPQGVLTEVSVCFDEESACAMADAMTQWADAKAPNERISFLFIQDGQVFSASEEKKWRPGDVTPGQAHIEPIWSCYVLDSEGQHYGPAANATQVGELVTYQVCSQQAVSYAAIALRTLIERSPNPS